MDDGTPVIMINGEFAHEDYPAALVKSVLATGAVTVAVSVLPFTPTHVLVE